LLLKICLQALFSMTIEKSANLSAVVYIWYYG